MSHRLRKHVVAMIILESLLSAKVRASDHPECTSEKRVIVEHDFMVFFDNNKSDLSSRDLLILDELIAEELHNPRQIIEMSAESDGSEDSSLVSQLRVNRGEAVRSYLIAHGISPQWLFVDASGVRPPLVVATPGVSEPQNRRVALWPRGLIEQETEKLRRDCVEWIRATCWQSPLVTMTPAIRAATPAIRAACDAAFAGIQ